MKEFKDYLREQKEKDRELVDDVVTALDDIGVDSEVLEAGKNFNVSFKANGTEYYIRPNDQGASLFYIDSDEDNFDEVKIADLSALKKKVKELKK